MVSVLALMQQGLRNKERIRHGDSGKICTGEGTQGKELGSHCISGGRLDAKKFTATILLWSAEGNA